ncbi:pur operon repressor [Shimazuella alba]|uniref:Pur operon repressor n=1 Tax=Shimazuella alba TaxID=2690964 RepID=A0A6I4W2H5_9BACL|nr:pur operon repressor [Shimazuella alba]MXQ54512.1 pur operon repressor [Shimazuella alba]
MEKWKRSARLVDMTHQLLNVPYQLIPLTAFAKRYHAAKSSISEDLTIIQEVLHAEQSGQLETMAGASGGVRYMPGIGVVETKEVLERLCKRLTDPERILPGGFLFMSDLLGDPVLLHSLGRIWAKIFSHSKIDVIVTVETKGIPLAYAAAFHLRKPVVIVRYDTTVTEGSVVTVNTVSGSSGRMKQLSLARRSLAKGSRVLVIDDYMKAGGTARGMIELLREFEAEVVGVGVMVDSIVPEKLVDNYVSLTTVTEVDEKEKRIHTTIGNLFDQGAYS